MMNAQPATKRPVHLHDLDQATAEGRRVSCPELMRRGEGWGQAIVAHGRRTIARAEGTSNDVRMGGMARWIAQARTGKLGREK
jgi:hypothetical protein